MYMIYTTHNVYCYDNYEAMRL